MFRHDTLNGLVWTSQQSDHDFRVSIHVTVALMCVLIEHERGMRRSLPSSYMAGCELAPVFPRQVAALVEPVKTCSAFKEAFDVSANHSIFSLWLLCFLCHLFFLKIFPAGLEARRRLLRRGFAFEVPPFDPVVPPTPTPSPAPRLIGPDSRPQTTTLVLLPAIPYFAEAAPRRLASLWPAREPV